MKDKPPMMIFGDGMGTWANQNSSYLSFAPVLVLTAFAVALAAVLAAPFLAALAALLPAVLAAILLAAFAAALAPPFSAAAALLPPLLGFLFLLLLPLPQLRP